LIYQNTTGERVAVIYEGDFPDLIGGMWNVEVVSFSNT
jgi:hypothetical protein